MVASVFTVVEPLAVMAQETQSGENKNDSYHTTHRDDANGEGRTIISNGLLLFVIIQFVAVQFLFGKAE